MSVLTNELKDKLRKSEDLSEFFRIIKEYRIPTEEWFEDEIIYKHFGDMCEKGLRAGVDNIGFLRKKSDKI